MTRSTAVPAPGQRTHNYAQGRLVGLPDVDTPEVSYSADSTADERYRRARDECTAATEHLARQHRRRAGRRQANRPVLDPQYEAALDWLESAESELRQAYDGRSALAR